MCTCWKFQFEFKDGALLDTGRRLLALEGTFKFPIFKGLGRVSLGQVGAQHSMITSEGLMSKPGKNVVQICLAICSKNANMSILAFHKYYITSLSPVFHTGFVRVDIRWLGGAGLDPVGKPNSNCCHNLDI